MILDAGVEGIDWLLLLISRRPLGVSEVDDLDPIRIQKAMFLLSIRGPARGLYEFRPYNWGPFSPQIYGDLEMLEARGLIQSEKTPGRTWRTYRTTARGEELAEGTASRLKPDTVQWLAQLRQFVTSRSFARLLRDIYAEYPAYATHSQLR